METAVALATAVFRKVQLFLLINIRMSNHAMPASWIYYIFENWSIFHDNFLLKL